MHQLASVSDVRVVDANREFGLWLDGIRMTRSVGRNLPDRLSSIAQLNRWHDDLTAAVVREQGSWIAAAKFGVAPVRGGPGITPISSGDELLAEGRALNHCVASYCDDILGGRYFVYRVTSPVRATLGIKRAPGGWVIDQIRGVNN